MQKARCTSNECRADDDSSNRYFPRNAARVCTQVLKVLRGGVPSTMQVMFARIAAWLIVRDAAYVSATPLAMM
jgi:hypothetical protein